MKAFGTSLVSFIEGASQAYWDWATSYYIAVMAIGFVGILFALGFVLVVAPTPACTEHPNKNNCNCRIPNEAIVVFSGIVLLLTWVIIPYFLAFGIILGVPTGLGALLGYKILARHKNKALPQAKVVNSG